MKQQNSKFAAMDGFSGSLDDAYAHGVLMATETRFTGTCQTCKHWSEANQPVGFGCCLNGAIGAFHERGESRIWLVPPAGFSCGLWEPKP